MRRCVPLLMLSALVVGSLPAGAEPIGCLGAPFTLRPVMVSAVGNSAFADNGGCLSNAMFDDLSSYLGTDATVGPGTLKLTFASPFTDQPGDEFAVRTGAFGPQGGPALLQFLLNGALQYSTVATLVPNSVLTFGLNAFGAANEVWITNLAPDPPGVDDLATISFIAAAAVPAVAPTPEPGTLLLLGSGVAALLGRRARRRQQVDRVIE